MADKLYDLSQLSELAGGDKDFIQSMVETFLTHTPEQLNAMKEALDNGNMSEVGALAHKIKPNIDLFGISQLSETIREVERMGKEEQSPAAVQPKVNEIDEVLQAVFNQLKNR